MKANELRIGNKVAIDGHETTITDNIMFDYDEGAWYVDDINITIVKPIPLTEEWWDKFKEDEFILTDKSGFVIFKNRYAYQFIFIDYPYVHQLQNLYFALTQKELIVR